ncbi:MAG: hypothetical protein LUC30_01765 [Clostridiales bacterium]|nr:hypothetical protein [Clostridiales bacterium]
MEEEKRNAVPLLTGPLGRMDRCDPLVPILCPDAETLLNALASGRAVPLCCPDDSAEGAETAAVTGLEPEALARALERLSLTAERAARLQGSPVLCLAEDRLVLGEEYAGPMLVCPVVLEGVPGAWKLRRGSENPILNRPLLDRLAQDCTAPEGSWRLSRVFLREQLEVLLADREDWRQEEGLWLGCFPVEALEQYAAGPQTWPEGSLAAALCAGGALSPESAPDPNRSGPEEEGILTPLPLDGVQMTALARLGRDGHLLVSGGRGSGRTQLLAGLLANAIGGRQHILAVARTDRDRADLLHRMEGLGLGQLCLHIPQSGDRKKAVLRQFNLALQRRPRMEGEDFFSLSQQSLQVSHRLDRYVAALHTPSRCGLSPYQLICHCLEERATEGLLTLSSPMLSHLDADGLRTRLDCSGDLAQAARALAQPPRSHPLDLVWGCEYRPELEEEIPARAEELFAALDTLEDAGADWCARTGMTAPSSREDWSHLSDTAGLLLEWQDYPAGWCSSSKIPMLSDTVQELRERTERLRSLQEQVLADWDESVFDMDAVSLEQQWSFLQAEWTLPKEPDRESALRRLLTQAEGLLNGLEQVGRQWSKVLQVPAPTTRDSWERYNEIAAELARWKDIPGEWGACSNLQGLLWDVGELIRHGKQAKESKEVILRDWNEDFLALDGRSLLARWDKEVGAWGVGLLRSRSDLRSQLESCYKGKLTSDSIESGIRWLIDFQDELAQCDTIYHRWERELKNVYKGEETVWVWLETARRVAEESHGWLTELTGSEDFLRKYGSSDEAVAAAEALQTQWEQAREVLGRLDVMIGRTGQPDSRDWLVERRNDCRRLRNLLTIRKQLETQAKEPVALGDLAQALRLMASCQRETEAIDALMERWAAELGDLYDGPDTDWDSLYAASVRAVRSDELLGEMTGDLTLRASLARDPAALDCARVLTDAFRDASDQAGRLEALATAHLTGDGPDWVAQLRAGCQTLLAHLDELEDWMNWRFQCRRGESLGLQSFVNYFDHPIPPEEDVAALFRKSLYWALLQQELDWGPELKRFSAHQFRELLRNYAQLDGELTRQSREALFDLAAARTPDLFREQELQEELGLLRWANRSGARDISLDGLLRGLPRLTRRLFPCILASPADALRCFSSAADGAPVFDYVTIDGADRLAPDLGARVVGLGRTALLLGDDAPSEDTLWANCQAAGVPELRLERCYLLRQESLQWPDRRFFGWRGLDSPHPLDFRVRYKTVVGRMEGNANPAEAAAVTDQAVRLIREGRTDIAIVTLTAEQARDIRRLLAQAAAEGPDIAEALTALPVAPTDECSSQGREIVLFSLTLAGDSSGSLSPARAVLCERSAARHFSDAFAAGREEVWIFSSLDRADWPRLEDDSLTELLDYATGQTLLPEVHPLPCRDRIQEELCVALTERGWLAQPGPISDAIRISHPDRPGTWLLAILLDGPDYGAIPRTRERELGRTELLSDMGWNLCRVWTMDWWQDRERVLEQLVRLLGLLLRREGASQPGSQSEETGSRRSAPPLYAPARLTVMGIRESEVSDPDFRDRIYRAVEEVLEQEAPISFSQLTCRVLTAFGLNAEDEALQNSCAALWRRLGLRVTREAEERYVWRLDQDPDHYRGFRRAQPGEHWREPGDVSCQESANAACYLLREQIILMPGELAAKTARLLGYDPEDEAALDCGRRGVDCAQFMGRVQETPVGTLVLADQR